MTKVELDKELERLDEVLSRRFGYSSAGTIHIWNCSRTESLCGRRILFQSKEEDLEDRPHCKTCLRLVLEEDRLICTAVTTFFLVAFIEAMSSIMKPSC